MQATENESTCTSSLLVENQSKGLKIFHWFQSMMVLAKHESLYISLLVQIVLKHLELFVLLFRTGSTTMKSCSFMVVLIRF